MPGLWGHCIAGGFLFAGLLTQATAQSIFTCVDAKGRRLTADRPIAECADREQKELSSTGTLKRKIGPVLTADEQAALIDKERKAVEERNRLLEEKKRDRALLTRYPDRAAHDKERSIALAVADGTIAAAAKRANELAAERKRIDIEMEFFKADPSTVPPKLKRQLEENIQHMAAQKRFMATHEGDRQRTNARFDEELVKLKQLWAQRAAPPGTVTPAAAKR